MKQTFKIMKNIPDPSDEEIRSYMNFDNLVASRNKLMKVTRAEMAYKIMIPLVVTSALLLWFLFYKSHTKETGSIKPPVPPVLKHIPLKDSITTDVQPLAAAKDDTLATKQVPAHTRSRREKKVIDPVPSADEYIQAEPIDGYSSLYNYLNSNLRYPSESIQDSIQGIETVSFTINRQGNAESIIITQSLGDAFDRESKRLIENMPAWKPATLNGKPVSSKISIPLTFQIKTVRKP